jgi:exonuclease SbcD
MKSPIALILTDTHLKEDNIYIVKSIFKQAAITAHELGIKIIDHAGDIFNSRKAQSQSVLTAFCEILDDLHLEGLTLHCVVGNHDKTDYGSADSFLDPFAEHPALQLYRTCGTRGISNHYDLAYLSFFSDKEYIEQFNNLVEQLSPTETVLLTHIGIAGSVMNNGTIIESESITPSLFKDFPLTLVGHFHDSQSLADGKIRYIGASLQHNFGELLGKGATVLYDDLSTDTIPLKYPQFIRYEIAPGDITKSDIEGMKQEKEESGDNIRIVLVGKESDVKAFNKQILIDAGVSVQHKLDDIDKQELEDRVEAFNVKDLHEEFKLFCEKNKLNVKDGLVYFNRIINVA